MCIQPQKQKDSSFKIEHSIIIIICEVMQEVMFLLAQYHSISSGWGV